eukprot:710091_1
MYYHYLYEYGIIIVDIVLSDNILNMSTVSLRPNLTYEKSNIQISVANIHIHMVQVGLEQQQLPSSKQLSIQYLWNLRAFDLLLDFKNIGKTIQIKRKPEREFGVKKEQYSNTSTSNNNKTSSYNNKDDSNFNSSNSNNNNNSNNMNAFNFNSNSNYKKKRI